MATSRIAVLPDAAPAWARTAVEEGGGTVAGLADAEALVWMSPTGAQALRSVLDAAPAIRWVQLPWAGVEEYALTGIFEDDRTWTCGKGVYAEPVAEHALALGLAGLRDLPDRVRADEWGAQSGLSLYDGRVTVLGAGGITESLAALLEPFRVELTVVRRNADVPFPGAAATVSQDRLEEALHGADLVVVALALTPHTRGIIAAPQLRAMADHAWLVNVGRGGHVVTDDLVTALREGWIGGAGLDVTDPEPLPARHPLWSLPNVIITPHTANTQEMARPMLSRRIRENVRRWVAGEPLIGLVDPHAGY